ncbi:MAG: zf-TFIIB domain-containing protein [Gammaproteobacteria bacterium]
MKCPACRKPLVVVERESIEVDWCTACHGVWFDAGELELLAGKAGKRLEPGLIGTPAGKIEEAPRRCPRCRRKMEKVTGGDTDLLLDRCLKHGLWFDAGELGTLMQRLADRAGEEAAVVGFLNETFSHSPAGGNKVPIKESNT